MTYCPLSFVKCLLMTLLSVQVMLCPHLYHLPSLALVRFFILFMHCVGFGHELTFTLLCRVALFEYMMLLSSVFATGSHYPGAIIRVTYIALIYTSGFD